MSTRMRHKQMVMLTGRIKRVAYAMKAKNPNDARADLLLRAARELIGHTVQGGLPDPHVLRDVNNFIKAQNIDYAVIGGLAVAVHGIARGTDDVDVVVSKLPDAAVLRNREEMKRYNLYPTTSRTGTMLIIDHKQGQVEMLVADTDLRRWIIDSAKDASVLGVSVPVMIPEALIAQKAHAMTLVPKRAAKDKSDIVSVLETQNHDVNIDLIRKFITDHEWKSIESLFR